jgi:hypothetical protein
VLLPRPTYNLPLVTRAFSQLTTLQIRPLLGPRSITAPLASTCYL